MIAAIAPYILLKTGAKVPETWPTGLEVPAPAYVGVVIDGRTYYAEQRGAETVLTDRLDEATPFKSSRAVITVFEFLAGYKGTRHRFVSVDGSVPPSLAHLVTKGPKVRVLPLQITDSMIATALHRAGKTHDEESVLAFRNFASDQIATAEQNAAGYGSRTTGREILVWELARLVESLSQDSGPQKP